MRKCLAAALLFVSVSLSAATRTWTGAVDQRWSNAGNWDSGVPQPGDELAFLHGQHVVTLNDLPPGMSFHSIFASDGPWTFTGNAITVTNGITTKTATFTMPVRAGGTQQFTAFCCHILEFSGGIDLNGQTLTLRSSSMNGDSGVDVNARITGTGTLLFSAQRLRLGIDDALPSSANVVLALGTFDMNDKSATVRSFEMSGGTTFAAGSKPLVVTERARLAGALTLRNAFDGMTILRNEGGAPVEGAFDQVPPGFSVTYSNDVVVHATGAQLIATSTTLTSTINPAHAGTLVMLVATVASASGPPSGTVTFHDDGVLIGTVPLNASGAATFTTTMLAPGPHRLTALFEGSSTHAASVSPMLTQTILGNRRRAVRFGVR